ncbi:MAG: S8 family peptidase, partial [Pseudonocardiaceae bacterium]
LALPLPEPPAGRAAAASTRAELSRIGRTRGPQRVLIGVTRDSALAGVRRSLERLGARPEAFEPIGVLAATVPSGAALRRALGGDPRVAYVERETELRIAADPLDTVDPVTGLKFTWFYDEVRAAHALLAARGGSRRSIAVMDTGLDTGHPELAGRISHTFDTETGTGDVFDAIGHGTFVTGLIAAIDGNGVGGKGVAGDTRVLAIRASLDGGFDELDLLRGIDFAIRSGADVLNMSLAGDSLNPSVTRALAYAFMNDVLPVAASGNRGSQGNPPQFPAVLLGGRRGRPGIGLSVAATRPNGRAAGFSTHNRYVSLAAPGAGPWGCEHGVLSTLPATATEWDDPQSCSRLVSDPSGARFAYGEGTSFAAAIVSGIAALVWQVEPRLASEQVAEVLTRSARQTRGRGWNEYTGAGV